MTVVNLFEKLFGQELYIDVLLKNNLDKLSSPAMDSFFVAITNLGSPLIYTVMALLSVIYLLVFRRAYLETIFLNLCLLTSWGIMSLLKEIFARQRPSGEHLTYATGFSFPSGHAMISLTFYGFIAYLLFAQISRPTGTIMGLMLCVLILLIGASRIYLNVHYASDVIGGFILGLVILSIFIKFYKVIRKRYISSLT